MKESRSSYNCTPIDQLLSDLYEQILLLKGYLRRLGFTEVETRHLIRNCMADVSAAIRTILRTLLVMRFADPNSIVLLEKRYGLVNTQTNSQDNSKLTPDLSEDDNKELIGKTVQLLKDRNALMFLENDLRDQVARLLIINPVKPAISLPAEKEVLVPSEKESAPQIFLQMKKETNAKKSYSLEEIRKKYPRAYEKWNKEEDEMLVELCGLGKSISELAIYFQRQSGAITSRLRKIELRKIHSE